MILSDRWDGSGAPFQGDRRLRLLALPAGARVARAVVRVEPARGEGDDAFVERLSFAPGAAPGAAASQLRQDGAGGAASWTEVDLRGRRTVHAVEGRGLGGAALHVDLGGGVFVPVDAAGGIALPGSAPFTVVEGDLTGPARLPGVAGTRLRLVRASGAAPELDAVYVRGAPSGVTLRLGDEAPFFIHPGELLAPVRTPDFAPLLALWLAAHARPEHGYAALPLTVHTATLGRLRVTVEVDLAMEASLLPPPVAEATLPFDFSTHSVRPPATPTWAGDLTVRLPAGARVRAGGTRMRLRGAFAETRVVPGRGPTGVVDPEQARGRARVSPDYAQAQQVPAGAEARIVGVDLLLRPLTRGAEIQVDLRRDQGGRPDQPILPRPIRIKVAQGEAADRPVWVAAALPEPFHIDADTPYWIVLQAVAGEAEWVAYPHDGDAARGLGLTGSPAPAPVPPPLMNTADGGASWRSGGPLLALFRLRTLPPRFTVPLAVEVGSGANAVRVPLDRFAPLARVDFILDDATLADAATAAARGGARRCPRGEVLADGRFEEWRAEGQGLGAPVEVGTAGAAPLHVAASPDGRWAYVLAGRGVDPVLLRIDVLADVLMDEMRLEGTFFPDPNACVLLVHPDGTRAYVLVQPAVGGRALIVHVVDLEEARSIAAPRFAGGEVVEFPENPPDVPARLAAALSPDGETLYVGAWSRVAAVHVPALEGAGKGGGVVRGSVTLEGTITCLALAPGGRRMCVGTTVQTGLLYVVDVGADDSLAPALSPSGKPFELLVYPSDVAVTADGARALVAHGLSTPPSGSGVMMVDLERGKASRVTGKAGVDATAIALTSDGRTAYVGARTTLATVDVERRTMVVSTLPGTEGEFLAVASTPQGDRVFAVLRSPDADSAAVRSVSVGTRHPVRWTATGPVGIGGPRGERPRGVVLGTTDSPQPDAALLLQTVNVREGCRYVFSFHATASHGSAAVAELFWMGARGELLDPDRVPIAEGHGFNVPPGATARTLRPYRRWLVAPPGAARVEVRFRVPSGAAEVAEASLLATADLVVNGDFRLPLGDVDGGWDVLPGPRAAAVRADALGGVVVRAVGPGAAELSQEVALDGGAPLSVRFQGVATVPAEGAPPELRVHWTGADGRGVGTPAVHPVLPGDFAAHPLRLEPPPGAVRAVVSLAVPPRATLHARALSAVPVPVVDVPIRFIAQAPGALTVSDARVLYDPPAEGGPGAAPSKAGGAGEGGPGGHPEGAAGDEPGGRTEDGHAGEGKEPEGDGAGGHHCAPAGGTDASAVTNSAAQPAALRTLALARPPAAAGVRWMPAGTLPPVAPPPPPPPPPLPSPVETRTPVLDVQGVGPTRQRRLVAGGIATAEDLAAQMPDSLARADPMLSRDTAGRLISAAKLLVQSRRA